MWEGILLGQHVKKLFFFYPNSFSERVYIYSSWSVSPSTSGNRPGSFFLSPENNEAVIHFCPRVISWDESPWVPWQLPLSCFLHGQRTFPQGERQSQRMKLREFSPAQDGPYVGPQGSSLTLSIRKRKHISTKPFPQLRGALLGGGTLLLVPLSWASGQGCWFQKCFLLQRYKSNRNSEGERSSAARESLGRVHRATWSHLSLCNLPWFRVPQPSAKRAA